jgi:hypothetical protein
MNSDPAPIDPDEPILRRIPVTPGFYDRAKAPPVQAGAFRPNPNDNDGISFYRERELPVSELVRRTNKPARSFTIVRLTAGDLLNLGLTLQPKQEDEDWPGHLVVPEINKPAYDDPAQSSRVKEFCRKLTVLSNRCSATFFPDSGDQFGRSDDDDSQSGK